MSDNFDNKNNNSTVIGSQDSIFSLNSIKELLQDLHVIFLNVKIDNVEDKLKEFTIIFYLSTIWILKMYWIL